MLKQLHVCYQVVGSLLLALAAEKRWMVCDLLELKYTVAVFLHVSVKEHKEKRNSFI